MSDTRAAIRELRTLSERRNQSALTEPEAARWVALRRQLGLPPEPANVDLSTPPAPAEVEPRQAVAASRPAAPLAPPPAPPAARATPVDAPAWEQIPGGPVEGVAPGPPPSAAAKDADSWTGPSLDSPSAPASSSWVGPALDAPAWSNTAAERPTDPGLDEPPPAPFDEAPAARPQQETRTVDLGGSPDDPVQLAAAAEFISYSRQGNEAIELPEDTASADSFQAQGLAELAGEAQPSDALAGKASAGLAQDDAPLTAAPLPLQSDTAADEGALPPIPAPLRLEAVVPDAPAHDAGALSLTPAPLPLPAFAPDAPADDEVALPATPAPLPLQAVVPEAPADDGGALPLTPVPLPLQTEVLEASAEEAGAASLTPAPLPLPAFAPDAPADEELGAASLTPAPLPLQAVPEALQDVPGAGLVVPGPEEPAPSSGAPPAPAPSPVSTWAPDSAAPPVLNAEEFARAGESLGMSGLDPWPESLPAEAPAEEMVETVGDEDLVEELSTPAPLPPFPVSPPPGSGGIRGFQFPKPPTQVPTPPTPPNWQRTEPGLPAFMSSAALKAPRPPSGASAGVAAPAPEAKKAAREPVAPPDVPLAPASAVSPGAFARSTLERPGQPVPATARAPATPPPAVPERPVSPRTATPVATPRAPQLVPSNAAPSRTITPKAVPAPPALKPVATEEETALPLLELVDEVEPPRPAAPERAHPVPTPPAGTQGVFGPPMMLNPGFVDGEHRVVIHTLEGQVHRGTVHDLDLQDDVLPLQQQDGRMVRIPSQRLKAVFFVLAPGAKHPPTRGERVQVTFRDGRQVVGYSEDHAGSEPGFFVVPSDARTNTARVYVYRGGVQSITTG